MPKIKAVIVGSEELKAKLKKLGQAVVQFNGDAALAGGEVIHDAAESLAPGPHIYTELIKAGENQAEVNIGPDKEHWFYQFFETGATSHEIKANKKKMLAFQGAKGLVITKKVNHPGMPAVPFLRPAMNGQKDAARERAGNVFRAAIERASNGS